jgi:hypothetical protein
MRLSTGLNKKQTCSRVVRKSYLPTTTIGKATSTPSTDYIIGHCLSASSCNCRQLRIASPFLSGNFGSHAKALLEESARRIRSFALSLFAFYNCPNDVQNPHDSKAGKEEEKFRSQCGCTGEQVIRTEFRSVSIRFQGQQTLFEMSLACAAGVRR